MSKRGTIHDSEAPFIPLVKNVQSSPTKRYQVVKSDSLESRCCKIIAANLERYPVEVIGVLDEEGWNAVVRERHAGTAPKKGKGGLDGTGRMAPAMKAQFLSKVEEVNPHLAESEVVDKLVWKDCVEYKFTAGGVERPNSLKYPWPVLVENVANAGSTLLGLLNSEDITERDKELLSQSILVLKSTNMSVHLLQSSGVGKLVKKFIKGCSKCQDIAISLGMFAERSIVASSRTVNSISMQSPLLDLEQLLEKWKNIAAHSGTKIAGIQVSNPALESDNDDTKIVEACQTWRSLYNALELRKTTRLASQGARMRERKRKLDTDRASIRKVQHSKPKPQHERILNRPLEKRKSSTKNDSSHIARNNKMLQLKKEAATIVSRQGPLSRAVTIKPKGCFGNAVAFTNGVLPKVSGTIKPKTIVVPLADGKQMKVPGKAVNQNELRIKGVKPTFKKRWL